MVELDWPADGARRNRVTIDRDGESGIPADVLTDPTVRGIYGLSEDTSL